MGCCTTKSDIIVNHPSRQKTLRKFTSQHSKVDDMRSQVLETALQCNEDKYYNDSELLQIGNEKLLILVNATTQEPKAIRWQPGELIGQGSFGRVIQAMNRDTGQLIAVKQVYITNDNEDDKVNALEIEIELLSLLNHKNIVSYYGMERNRNTLNIFLEYVAGGSLTQMIQKFGKFNESLIKAYMRQIVEGLDYLHQHGIMHRDIKGGNVLVDGNGVCKLADFGSSKKLSSLVCVTNSLFGTPYFMAPEVVQQDKPGRKADIWSLGCTMIEMATGKPPWSDMRNPFAVMIKIGKGEIPPIPDNLSEDAKDFLQHCIERLDPVKRWNARKLLSHVFLQRKQLDTPLRQHSNARTPLKVSPSMNKKRSNKFTYPQNLMPPMSGNVPDQSPTSKNPAISPKEEEQLQQESPMKLELHKMPTTPTNLLLIQPKEEGVSKQYIKIILTEEDIYQASEIMNNDDIQIVKPFVEKDDSRYNQPYVNEISQLVQEARKIDPISPSVWMKGN